MKGQKMGILNWGAVEFQRQRWLEEEETNTNSHTPPVDYRFNSKGFSMMRDLIAYFDKRMNKILSGNIEDETGEILFKNTQNLNNTLVIFARYATALDATDSVRHFVRLSVPEYVQKIKKLNRSGRLSRKINVSELQSLIKFVNLDLIGRSRAEAKG